MYYIYILRCRNNSLYTGITVDLYIRMAQHRSGNGSKYVRAHLPFELVYIERLKTKSLALRREIEIKKLPRLAKEKLLNIFTTEPSI